MKLYKSQKKIFWTHNKIRFKLNKWKNIYLSHRIIYSFPWISKRKIIRLKTVWLALTNFCNLMLCMIFQSGWEPVLIQPIEMGFEAILENSFPSFSFQFSNLLMIELGNDSYPCIFLGKLYLELTHYILITNNIYLNS